MNYDFLVDIYRTERLKVLSVWGMFHDEDLDHRPHPQDTRGRSAREHMIHQCISEDMWFRTMFGIDVGTAPLPSPRSSDDTRIAFIHRYAEDSAKRLEALTTRTAEWWSGIVPFFETRQSRAWVMVRRIAHTAHHRGQQTVLLRTLNREVYSTYGPSADTGGLPKNGAQTLYAYPDEASLIEGELAGGRKTPLPEKANHPLTERPEE